MHENKDVEFGIKVPTLSEDGSSGPNFIGNVIRFIQEVGDTYGTLWISDHLMPWVEGLGDDADTLESWTTICYLAGVFKNLKLGSAVLCNTFRNPTLLAKMAATLNVLTGNRFILGLGAGWNEREHVSYGYEFTGASARIRRLEEAVRIIRMMWTEDEVNFDGRYYNVRGARCYPRPTAPPTIMIGGGGEKKTLRVIAGYADWWNIPATPIKILQHKIEVLKGHCSSMGRDFHEIRKTLEGFVAIAETKEEADKIASRGRKAHFNGTPEMVVEQLNKYIDLGFEYYLVRFLDQPGTLGAKLFSERVVPFLNCRTR